LSIFPFKGKNRRNWIISRRTVQGLALFSFLVLFVGSRRGGIPAEWVNLPMRLDPLTGLANLLSGKFMLTGSLISLIVLAATLIWGRAWCGWVCPLGTILDVFSLRSLRLKHAAPSEAWRGIKYVLLLVILFAAILGNLTLLFLDPLTLLFRSLSTSIWPAIDQIVTAVETLLYRIGVLDPAIAAFDGLVRPKILPGDAAFYRYAFLYGLIFFGVIGLNVFASRFWCRYLCPLGGMLGLISKVAIFRREVNQSCSTCGVCASSCPTGTIDAHRGYSSDPAECTLCMECVSTCARAGVSFPAHRSFSGWMPYDPSRRKVLGSLGAAVAGSSLLGSELIHKRENSFLIRPPAARENDLTTVCVRCGECMRACPTTAIQPAVSEAGLEGLLTPVLILRSGYCDYSCNACGQVCPVQAIPPLTLDEKRLVIIGKAYIDQNRCIAWADGTDCIVCEEMCPVPEKAVVLKKARVMRNGVEKEVQQPIVERERCIGCGICEYKCPVNGDAAIRVYVPNNL
jgi:polyferredoxin